MPTILNNGQPILTEADLNTAISAADSAAAGSGAYEIDLGGNIALTTALQAISLQSGVTLDIEGGGSTLGGGGTQHGLVVTSGTVTIENLAIDNTLAQGAAGGGGSGGNAGLGGGLFVGSAAAVTLTAVSFSGDAAKGGNGGSGNAGGNGSFKFGGLGASGGGGGSGSGGGFGQGGGGGAGGHGNNNGSGGSGSTGNNGGFGGGKSGNGGNGGGGHTHSTFGSTGAGGGGGGGGGGGLGAGGDIYVQQGGSLTIGGAATESAGTVAGGGGGGGGAAGSGGSTAAKSGTVGSTGFGYGSGIFIQGNQSVTFDPATGQTLTVSGVIADMTGSHDAGGQTGAGSVIMNGAGTLALSAANTFTGGTTIDSGTVELAAAGAGGAGAISFANSSTATLQIDAAALPAVGQPLPNAITNLGAGDTVDIHGATWDAVVSNNAGALALNVTGEPPIDFNLNGSVASFTISTGADQAPVMSVAGALEPPAAGSTTAVVGVSVGDADAVTYNETTTVLVSDTNGTLSATATTGATVGGAGTTSVTLSGTLAGVNAELATLTYTAPAAGGATTDTISFSANDGRGGTSSAATSVVVDQTVTTEAQLNSLIVAADNVAANTGTIEINLGNDISLGTALEAINLRAGVTLDIQGNGHTISGNNSQRGLFVYAGNVTVENLTIANAKAMGGNAAVGGGGGAGLGGGLFIANNGTPGTVTLSSVSFTNDAAVGGAGGGPITLSGVDGGGGGLGGNGGTGPQGGGGGGIGGAGGVGYNGAGQAGIVSRAAAGGEGYLSPAGGDSGGGGGANGNHPFLFFSVNFGTGHTVGGGGGGGGGIGGAQGDYFDENAGQPPDSTHVLLGIGGAGGFGGGGGGGSLDGAAGGFGGGGGAGGGPSADSSGAGGDGGFGGGGGTGGVHPNNNSFVSQNASVGGFGAGNAQIYSAIGTGGGGGGGLGAGGDIFVQAGASLIILGNSSLAAGTVTGGQAGSAGAGTGGAYGNGIFLEGNQSATFAPSAGQTLTVSGVIADMNGAGYSNPFAPSNRHSPFSGAGSLVMSGTGTLALAATNTFTGGTTIDSGTVELAAVGAEGSGAITFAAASTATLQIDAAALTLGETFTVDSLGIGDTIDVHGATWDATIANNAGTPTLAVTGTPPVDFDISGNTTALTLTVAADQAPTVSVPASLTFLPGEIASITSVSVSDADAVAYNETTTVAVSDTSGLLAATAAAGAIVAGAGTTSLTLSGTLAAVNAELATLTYTAAGADGTDSISFAANDGRGGSGSASTAVTLAGAIVNETATVSSSGSVSGTAGTSGSGVLAGDVPPTGLSLSVAGVSGGALGSAVHGTYGDLTLNADGSFTYVSGANATELGNLAGATGQVTDAFTYAASDGDGGSVAATLSVNVDDSKPSVTGIGFAFPSTQLTAGNSGTIALAMSNVGAIDTTKGTPTLTLNDGAVATLDAAKSSTSTLVFDYTVGASDTNVASLAVSSVNLDGAVTNASGVVATSALSVAGLAQNGPQIGSGAGTPPVVMSTLVTFNGGASSLPQTTPIIDAAGNLYGETTGQPGSTGTIFEIAKTGGLYASTPGPLNTGHVVVNPNDQLFGIPGQTIGVVPQSALFIDAAGSVIFSNMLRAGSLTPSSANASIQLVGANAVHPIVLATKPGQWAPQIALITGNDTFVVNGFTGSLDLFTGVNASAFGQTINTSADIALPVFGVKGAMAVDGAGNVFGTTANGAGSIFELSTSGGTIGAPITLANFNGFNGADPEAGLIADGAGNLFGTTFSGGGSNDGTVFELVKSGSSYTLATLASFTGANGANPDGGLLEDGAGNLFGTTKAGGANGDGTVFEIAKTGGIYASTPTTLLTFNGSNGAAPESGLTFDAAGNLFGTTSAGGANNAGTVFELSNGGFDATIAPWVTTEQAAVTTGRSVAGTAGASGTGALAGDVDYNGLVHSVSAITGGALGTAVHGTYGDLTLNADGSFNYVAAATATEIANIVAATGQVTDAFAYSVTDGHGHSGGATLDISLDATKLTGPTVTGAVATPSSGEFNTGKIIPIFVEMSKPVTVTGTTATLTLSNGGIATLDAASTASLQGLGLVAFDYKVASTDQDAAGLTISSVNLNGTTITDSVGLPAAFSGTLPSLPGIDIVTVAPTLSAITVDNIPLSGPIPQIFVVQTTTLQTPVTFSASATDPFDGNNDQVVFTENGNVVHSGDNFSPGIHTIYASATNSGGITTSEPFAIEVLPSSIVFTNESVTVGATGLGGAHVTLSASAQGGIGSDQVQFTEGQKVVQSGDLFGVGGHLLQVTATDAIGDHRVDQFLFFVSDSSPPVLPALPDITIKATTPAGTTVTFPTSATDLVDGSDTIAFTDNGRAVHSGDAFSIGTHTITASVTDTSGLSAGPETFNITVLPATPVVTSILASPPSGDKNTGNTIALVVTLDQKVMVTGTPVLTLNDGGSATYESGAGTNTLVFVSTVANGQNAATLAVTGNNLNGSTVAITNNATGAAADLSGADVSFPGLAVGATVSSIAANLSSGDLGPGKKVVFTVTMSEAVKVAGAPYLALNDNGKATYTSGSGTNVLTFTYTVGAVGSNQNVASLAVTGFVVPTGAAVYDSNNVLDPADLSGVAPLSTGVQIDTTAPTIGAIASISGGGVDAGGNGDLNAGKVVTLAVNFGEAATIAGTGTPTLALNDGGTAVYQSGSGSGTLLFTYTVLAGQNTADLALAASNALRLNGATIRDAAGNNAILTGANNANPTGTLKIDTTPPIVSTVVASPGPGEVTTGQTVTISLNMSEPIIMVGGAPVLLLNDGGVASYDPVHSTQTTAMFNYIVGSHDLTTDLVVSGIELASTSSIQDLAGNNANLARAGANLGLHVNTAKSGTPPTSGGTFNITGSTDLELIGASTAGVTFAAGSTGTLKLDSSQKFAGTVAGLAQGNYLDLTDIAFGAGTTLGYTANGGNTGGTLKVSDATHTANLQLLGNYSAASFVTSNDGMGHVLVTEPPPSLQLAAHV